MAESCQSCDMAPCVCDYVRSMKPGGRNEYLAETAKAQVRLPLPHRGGCPCVLCWAERMRSWDNVVPLRAGGSGRPAEATR